MGGRMEAPPFSFLKFFPAASDVTHMMNEPTSSNYINRECWLEAAMDPITKHFAAHGYTIPPLRVSCGWPSSGGTSEKKRCIGQAWSAEAASDGVIQIFISPWLQDATEEQGVLATLVHEVCHAVVGNAEKHNKVFGKCARAVGLEGKLTATHASEALVAEFKHWAAVLGEYPHGKLDLLKSPTKKQTVRMLKMTCETCGCVARMAKKWFDEVGSLHCPSHGPMKFELPDADQDEDDSAESE